LFGGLERVMATHITGELVPILKDAGALWLWSQYFFPFFPLLSLMILMYHVLLKVL
jgi:hypothetical protein